MHLYNLSTFAITETAGWSGTGHTDYVMMIIQINANQVATCSRDFTIKIWNTSTSTLTLVNTYYGHTSWVSSIVVLPNGKLASGGNEGVVRVWDMVNNTVNTVATGGGIISMVWNPVSQQLVMNFYMSLQLYNPTTQAVNTIHTGDCYYDADVILPTGNLIIAGFQIDLISLPSGNRTFSTVFVFPRNIQKLKMLPDNVTAVCGFRYTAIVQLFNVNSTTLDPKNYTAHNGVGGIVSITITPDLLFVLTLADSNTLAMWTWSTMSLTLVKMYSSFSNLNFAALVGYIPAGGNLIFFFFEILGYAQVDFLYLKTLKC
jgi:WD40 repeat protein